MTKMKTKIYNQFQLRAQMNKNKIFIEEIKNKTEIKRPQTKLKTITNIRDLHVISCDMREKREKKQKIIHWRFANHRNTTCATPGGRKARAWETLLVHSYNAPAVFLKRNNKKI